MPRTVTAASPDQTSIDDLLAGAPRADPRAHPVRALCTELLRWEGYRRDMYLDRRGEVRTGVGHWLPSAQAALALPWRHRPTGLPATAREVRAAFDQVCAQGAGHPAPAHERASDLVLPPGFGGVLIMRRLERELLPALRKMCRRFDDFPLPAQRALVEMAYNVGVEALPRFYNLIAACNRWDFAAAADHCNRRTVSVVRNVATRQLFRKAAGSAIE